jgi:uncharacterized protein
MMNILSLAIDIILAAYIGWEVVRFIPRYRQLKQDIAKGDPRARTRVYNEALVFEWVSALLAVLALRFDWSKFKPQSLALGSSKLIQQFSVSAAFDRVAMAGLVAGVAIGSVGFIVVRLIANRRSATTAASAPASRWQRFVPDFSSLVPVTPRERFIWTAVAISAGICEEIVFRGWLLATLHGPIGLSGTALIVAASAIFGLAHLYQRATGVVATAFAGAVFCVLYIKTGSLLVPILLHVLIDVRFAVLPAPRTKEAQTAYA